MKKFKIFCPLSNFQILTVSKEPTGLSKEERTDLQDQRERELTEGVDVYEGVRIRRISKTDFEDMALDVYYPMPREVVKSCSFVLEKCIDEEDDINRVNGTLRSIVLAMRLLKKGYFSGSDVFCIVVSEKRRPYSHTFSRRRQWFGARYMLNFDELLTLGKLVKPIEGVHFDKQGSLHLAFRRFQSGLDEDFPEDKLIDFLIAFEALFLRGEKAGISAGQIVAVACSVLLGKNDKEREEIRQSLSKAYSTRNGIVHASKHPFTDKPLELGNFVPEIEEYLRQSIKRFLDQV